MYVINYFFNVRFSSPLVMKTAIVLDPIFILKLFICSNFVIKFIIHNNNGFSIWLNVNNMNRFQINWVLRIFLYSKIVPLCKQCIGYPLSAYAHQICYKWQLLSKFGVTTSISRRLIAFESYWIIQICNQIWWEKSKK